MIPVLFRVLAYLYSVAVGASVCMLLCGRMLCGMPAYALLPWHLLTEVLTLGSSCSRCFLRGISSLGALGGTGSGFEILAGPPAAAVVALIGFKRILASLGSASKNRFFNNQVS